MGVEPHRDVGGRARRAARDHAPQHVGPRALIFRILVSLGTLAILIPGLLTSVFVFREISGNPPVGSKWPDAIISAFLRQIGNIQALPGALVSVFSVSGLIIFRDVCRKHPAPGSHQIELNAFGFSISMLLLLNVAIAIIAFIVFPDNISQLDLPHNLPSDVPLLKSLLVDSMKISFVSFFFILGRRF
jgi:hypothetical protein